MHADGSVALAEGREAFAGSPEIPDRGTWNRLRIVARGTRVEVAVNGIVVTRYDGAGVLDDEAHRRRGVGMRGYLALQLHAGNDLRIQFKDMRIREISPAD